MVPYSSLELGQGTQRGRCIPLYHQCGRFKAAQLLFIFQLLSNVKVFRNVLNTHLSQPYIQYYLSKYILFISVHEERLYTCVPPVPPIQSCTVTVYIAAAE